MTTRALLETRRAVLRASRCLFPHARTSCLWLFGGLTLFGCDSSDTTGATSETTVSDSSTTSTMSLPAQVIQVVDSQGMPESNIPLVVNDESGVVVHVDRTGMDGTASIEVPAGGSVSIFQAHTTTLSVTTVVDPPPGGTVRFPIYQPEPKWGEEDAITTYEVGLTDIPVDLPYLLVFLDGYCGTMGSWIDLSTATIQDSFCTGAPTHKLLAFAYDDQKKLVRWGSATVDTNPGGKLAVSVALSNESLTTTSMKVTGLPSGTTKLYLSGSLTEHWYGGEGVNLNPPKADTDGATVRIADVPAIDRALHVSATVGDGSVGAVVGRTQRFSPATLPTSWTFAMDSVAWVFVNPADTTDPEHPAFTWSTADPQTADYVSLWTSWTVGVGTVNYEVLLPPTHVASWRAPDVPEELSSFRPHATSPVGQITVNYRGWESIPSYADALAGLPADVGNESTDRSGWTVAQ